MALIKKCTTPFDSKLLMENNNSILKQHIHVLKIINGNL